LKHYPFAPKENELGPVLSLIIPVLP
jgi:hypothetical protein